MSKYRPGQVWTNADGFVLRILSVDRTLHGNTSRLVIEVSGHPRGPQYDGVSQRPVRTQHVSTMIHHFNLTRAKSGG